MNIRSLLERHWKVACVIAGCWTFLALLFTPLVLQNGQQLMLSRNYRDKFFGLLGEL